MNIVFLVVLEGTGVNKCEMTDLFVPKFLTFRLEANRCGSSDVSCAVFSSNVSVLRGSAWLSYDIIHSLLKASSLRTRLLKV